MQWQQIYACGCRKIFDSEPDKNGMCDEHSDDAVITRPYSRTNKMPTRSATHVYNVFLIKLRMNYLDHTEDSTDAAALSAKYGIAQNIVEKVLDKLEKEGIIVPVDG